MRIEIEARDGAARAGVVHTERGRFATPAFMPVGTRGAVRGLDSLDLAALGFEVVLANTYHLMLRPGAELVARRGGLHGFMAWDGHLLTDSGGFQVFSLAPQLNEDGVRFSSVYDGSHHHLSPESAVTIQAQLGADIQMALDVCPALPAPRQQVAEAMARTHRWAARARTAWLAEPQRPPHQAQFGIVQGGVEADLRTESAQALTALGFDGYGIGGLSVGEPREQMLPALAAAAAELPADKPRYLMGVGDPIGLIEGVAHGVDLFDCVLPTRLARHGTVLTSQGRLNLRNARYAEDDSPLDPDCLGPVSGRYSRAYLRHLLSVKELAAARLITLHNLWWLRRLLERARAATQAGSFGELRREVWRTWEAAAP
ncbi:MAG: tRNA guanosine(34) transglycosylase Tgt [Acidimicrobiales bacterium]